MSDSVSGNAGQTLAAAPLLARLRDPDIFVDAVDEACELIERQEWEIRRLLQAIAICDLLWKQY